MRGNAKGALYGKSPLGQDAGAPKKSCLSEIQRLQKVDFEKLLKQDVTVT